MEQETTLAELLLAFRRKIAAKTKGDSLKDKLTFSQLEALWFLGYSDKTPKTMDAIAAYLKITPPSATSLIEKMERKGLVKRERHKEDRRVVLVSLEEKIKKFLLKEWQAKEKVLHELVHKLPKVDQRHLERIMKKLIEE